MLEFRDYLSGILGAIIFLLGLLPLLNKLGKGAPWFGFELPVLLMSWVLLLGGGYLILDAFVEILNGNFIGWISMLVAVLFAVMGLLAVFGSGKTGFLAMSWITPTVYGIFFLILGVFLMVATIARKL